MRSCILTICLLSFYSTSFALGENIAKDIAEEGKDSLTGKGKEKVFKYSKNGARSVINKAPGGSFLTNWLFDDGESMEDKVDRIDKNEQTALTKIRTISRDALKAKRRIEDMWYFQNWTLNQGKSLAEKLRKSRYKKLLLSALESYLLIPLNPAEYVPNIPPFEKLKKSVEFDLSLERGVITDTKYLLNNTRAALMYSGVLKKNPKDFDGKYKEAQEYETTLMDAMRAKEIAMIKIDKAQVEKLQDQIKDLEEEQAKEGVSVDTVVAIELLIDKKKERIKKLNQNIDKAIKRSTILNDDQRFELQLRELERDQIRLQELRAKERKTRSRRS
jgi:hypothetical protein